MTRKDFIAIAQTLRTQRRHIPDYAFRQLVEALASTFTQINPRFSYSAFISAIFED